MKVFEIISEAPEYTTPGGIVIPSGAKTAEPIPTKSPEPALPKTPNAAVRANTAIKQQIQSVGDVHKKVTQTIANAPKRTKRIEALWQKKYGTLLTTATRLLGITVALTDLYTELDTADEMYQKEEISSAVLEQYREWAFGRFAAQILVPSATKLLSRAVGITFVVRMIKNAIGVAGATVSFGATAATAIASEVFFVWLQNWLSSPEATKWLTNDFMMPIVRTMGQIPEAAWSSLTGYYERAEKSKPNKPGAAPATKPTASAAQTPAGAAPSAEPDDAEKLIKKLGI